MRLFKRIRVYNRHNIVRMNLKFIRFGSIGNNIRFGGVSWFGHAENIYVDDNVFFGPDCYFDAMTEIHIAAGCMFGPRVFCVSGSHNYSSTDLGAVPYDDRIIDLPIVIERNVWIAGNVSIAPGTHIGEGSVVALGAVVAGWIPPYSVVIGNKAQPVKKRDVEQYRRLVEQGRIYNMTFAGKPFYVMSQ